MNASNINQLRPRSRHPSVNRSRNPSVTSLDRLVTSVNKSCACDTSVTYLDNCSCTSSTNSNQSTDTIPYFDHVTLDTQDEILKELFPDVHVELRDRKPYSSEEQYVGAYNCEGDEVDHLAPRSSKSPGDVEEEKIKRRLKFFFMNPIDKYQATKKTSMEHVVTGVKSVDSDGSVVDFCQFPLCPRQLLH